MIRPIPLALGVLFCLAIPSLHAQEKFLGRTADGWAGQLKVGDVAQRRSAAFALGKMGGRAVPVLGDLKAVYAKEKDAKVREAIVFALGEICRDTVAAGADRELEKLFLGAITDRDVYLRRSAAFALGALGSKSAATRAALDTALGDEEAIVRQNAAFALAQFGVDALPSLKKALGDRDSFVKRDAASVLLQISDGDKVHELLKDLLPLCRDTNSEVRRAALNVLVRIVDSKDREAIAPLRVALEDRDIENKRNAALALTNIGGEETVIALPVLLDAIKNGDAEARRQSVLAIRNIGSAAATAIPELLGILKNDPDTDMRGYAALAIGGMGKAAEPAVPFLVEKIQDAAEARGPRTECAMALARIGPVAKAEQAVPVLLEVLGNPKHDGKVRERIMWALRVHGAGLKNMKGPLDTFSRVCMETRTEENKMLRYDSAYMLGMVWQADAPAHTLDVLTEFLRDETIKIYDKTVSGVTGVGTETVGGKASVDERGKGDGRIMAADALKMMGPTRYAGRADLMKQLRVLAADNKLYEPLQKKSAALVKAAQ